MLTPIERSHRRPRPLARSCLYQTHSSWKMALFENRDSAPSASMSCLVSRCESSPLWSFRGSTNFTRFIVCRNGSGEGDWARASDKVKRNAFRQNRTQRTPSLPHCPAGSIFSNRGFLCRDPDSRNLSSKSPSPPPLSLSCPLLLKVFILASLRRRI